MPVDEQFTGRQAEHLIEEQVAQAVMIKEPFKISIAAVHALAAADDQCTRLGHPAKIRFFFIGGLGCNTPGTERS